MNIQEQLDRLLAARNKIRTKLSNLGIAVESNARLDDLAEKIDRIVYQGAPNAQVTEGTSYTIEPGYYSGGSVHGVSGGGNYTLQEKSITPTKEKISVSHDVGYYGLSRVEVQAIPEAYQDVSDVNADAADVLTSKKYVSKTGALTVGTMPNNGAVSKTLDATSGNQSYTVPRGYHSGSGTVSISLETKSVTPTESSQDIIPATGKVLSKVTVGAIPSKYGDVSEATVTAADILEGVVAIGKDATGNAISVTGSMVNNEDVSTTIDGIKTTSVDIPAGYTTGGTVSLTSAIEDALAAI